METSTSGSSLRQGWNFKRFERTGPLDVTKAYTELDNFIATNKIEDWKMVEANEFFLAIAFYYDPIGDGRI